LAKKGRRIERDIIFLERCVNLLKPNGRIAIVIPHNKLGSGNWEYARKWLLRNLRIVGVLSLERNTFMPHTHQKASVLFGVKRIKPIRDIPKNDEIIFLVSEKSGKNSKGKIILKPESTVDSTMWYRSDHDLDSAVESFQYFIKNNKIAWG